MPVIILPDGHQIEYREPTDEELFKAALRCEPRGPNDVNRDERVIMAKYELGFRLIESPSAVELDAIVIGHFLLKEYLEGVYSNDK